MNRMTPSRRSLLPILGLAILSLAILAATSVSAKPVTQATARDVATAQYRMVRTSDPAYPTIASASLTLAYEARAVVATGESRTMYYVFNTPDAHGFVIVAGDDAVEPVLGYSTETTFSSARPSPEFLWWVRGYEAQIAAVIQSGQAAPSRVKSNWEGLIAASRSASVPAAKRSAAVGPLLTTRWNQSPYYNDLCPFDAAENERSVTGCVATAVSQIMRYHRSPARGSGEHGYSHERYGYLHVNFANATYNWNAMPDRVTSPNQAVALLMYHVGVASDMEYSPSASGAFPSTAAEALVKYFGYKNTVRDVERRSYDNNSWENLIRAELDAARPVEYHGFGDGSGHSFVCDGYNGNMFHINWGWDGAYNGYFLLSDLTPDGVGTGGGAGSYNNSQGAIIGITPETPTAGEASMEMAADLVITPNPATSNGIVNVSFDLHNAGTSDFQGDYCVALFDQEGTFVRYLGGVWTGMSLKANFHYTNGLSATDTLFGVYPGTYDAVVFSKRTGKEWEAVAKSSFNNSATLELGRATYASDLSIYAAPEVNLEAVHVGEAFSVHTDFANGGNSDFSGDIGAWAYTADGRTDVGEIQILTNLQLGAGNHWVNGQTFSCAGLNVPPGRYMIAFFNRPDGDDWQFVNPGNYVNPVMIDVLPSVLTADRYEPNDAQGAAFGLTLSYSGNSGSVTTAGSNIHASGNDDYYRVTLPAGYTYNLTGALHDSWTDENGGFTNDVSVMWNAGDGWSEVYDDSTDAFTVEGGRTVTFKVQSLFLGTLGTYRLDIRGTRAVSGVADPTAPAELALSAYPSPASTDLNVRLDRSFGRIISARLVDASGREGARVANGSSADAVHIDLTGVASGAYTLLVDTDRGALSRRVVVRH